MAERRTTPVELLWDLAFVFAITQVSAFLVHHLSWSGCYHGMILLALVWWACSAFVWALLLIFIAGLAVPAPSATPIRRCSRSPTPACG